MSWLSALIWVNVRHFFPWEPLDILFWNLMGRLFSMKGSDCAIFHIFLGTFGCASQKFRDYFCISTFPPQRLVRLGWNLARSFPRRICAFSGHFPSHQWISIFISGLWLSTTVGPKKRPKSDWTEPIGTGPVVYFWTGLLQPGCWSFILKNIVGTQKDRFKSVATG